MVRPAIKNKTAYVAIAALETLAQLAILVLVINLMELFGAGYIVVVNHIMRSEGEAAIAFGVIFTLDLLVSNLIFNWLYYRRDAVVIAFGESLVFLLLMITSFWLVGLSGIFDVGFNGYVVLMFAMFYSLAIENYLAKKLRENFESVG